MVNKWNPIADKIVNNVLRAIITATDQELVAVVAKCLHGSEQAGEIKFCGNITTSNYDGKDPLVSESLV